MSEPAVHDAPLVSETVKGLDPAARAAWQLTGDLPGESSSTDAASSPAEPAEQATSTDARLPAASEPATSTSPVNKSRPNADTRKAELQADIEALVKQRNSLKAELAAPRPQAPPDVAPVSSPAPVTLADTMARPDLSQPALTEQAFFQRFPDATYGEFTGYSIRHALASVELERRREAHAATHEQTVRSHGMTFAERLATARAANPALAIDPALLAHAPTLTLPEGVAPRVENAIAQEVLTSDDPAALLEYWTAHPDEYQALLTINTPLELGKAIGRLELKLTGQTAMPTKPTVKTVTSAPAPAQTLGSKPSAPADKVEAAIGRKDFRSYRDEMNRREVAS